MTLRANNLATNADAQVRIGELAVSSTEDVCLTTVGLGSCVGVSIFDPATGIAGLAHVFLPEPPPSGAKPGAGAGTYAVMAVPELARRVSELGNVPTRKLRAVIAGGARMFAGGRGGVDVGERNIQAVIAALETAGVRLVAQRTGGSHGRTMRVTIGTACRVTVREVGQQEQDVWSAAPRAVEVRQIAA